MTAAERVTVSLLDLDDAAHRADDPAGLTPGDVTAGAAIGDGCWGNDVGLCAFASGKAQQIQMNTLGIGAEVVPRRAPNIISPTRFEQSLPGTTATR